MKKHVIITVLAIVLLLTSCQPTPEESGVVGKREEDVEAMLDKATTPNSEVTMLSYESPDRWQHSFEVDLGDDHFLIDVDAVLEVPEGALPIIAVKPKQITFDQVDGIIQLVQNGENLYKGKDVEGIMTKAIIQERIDKYMNEIAQCPEESKDVKREYQAKVRKLYKALETAPESYEGVVLREQDTVKFIGKDGEIQYEEKNPNAGKVTTIAPVTLTQDNYNQLHDLIIGETYLPPFIRIGAENGVRKQAIVYKNASSIDCHLWSRHDLSFMDGFDMSVEEAVEKAAPYVKAIDDQLVLIDVGPAVSVEHHEGEMIEKPYGYLLAYGRSYEGVYTNYTVENDSWFGHPERFDDIYEQELLVIMVTKQGIYSLDYRSPLEVVRMETENVKLLPFEDIQKIFQDHVALERMEMPKKGLKTYLKITRIKLGMMRIAKPNSNEYLVVPVWDFYGGGCGCHGTMEENKEDVRDFFGRSYLTINAINGAIIDRALGY